ncbi:MULTISPECIES: NACHT domain-containing protein [Streptomyces]|uniref:ATP-binding protein n=1 Tax=Streptomyces cacaoi TaxID=1898 RepID=A0A4Y3R7E5_STRCI|nr:MULTISPECIES: NACHT domain-containing protein [Streptomyces]NNG87429.1 NACHT domain-containing protein [Streptomyces cacaoi]GEB53665.1 ATP-binding protein [Streptomyces cacaoi]
MDPAVRLASTVADPLVSRLLLPTEAATDDGAHPGEPELLARIVSFRGADPPLGYEDLLALAEEFVARTAARHHLPTRDEAPVATVLSRTLWTIGELPTTDAQAVRLGPQDYARTLRSAVPGADRELSPEAAWFHDRLLVTVCLHLLHQLIRRSPRLSERLPERAHRIRQLVDLNDVDAVRSRPEPSAHDAAFEARYAHSVVELYNHVTIHGIDLPNPNTPDSWSLDATYLSLSAEFGAPGGAPPAGPDDGDSGEPVLSVDRALGGHERVLLRGVAGSGKTTLVQWLAVTAARDAFPAELATLRGRIPLVLPVRRFAREGFPGPDDFLHAVRHPLADEAPDGWVARVLTEERGLLLVDGIDEAPEAGRAALRDALRRLMRIYSGNFCLVTSRHSAVEPDWLADEGFDELALAPMNRDQVAAFITAWHTAAADDEGKDHAHLTTYRDRLLATIPLYRELRGLATNPLMCGLICALNRDRSGSLPQGRKELYEAAMQMLLQRRDPERRVLYADAVRLQRSARERLLRKLAYRMLTEHRSELTTPEALDEIGRHLPAIPAAAGQGGARGIFNHLLLRTGVLREQSARAVEFVHRTVQDYLAAKEAVEQGAFDLLLAHAHESEWEEVIRMAVAHARPAECARLLGGLLAPGHTGMQRNRRRLLAAACLEHVTELDPDTHARIRRETRHMVRPTTVAAARSLGWVGPIVLEMLPDPAHVPDDEAYRLAVTVTRISDDAAIHYLAQLRNRASLKLRAELAHGWRNFDTDRYAEEIISHLDPEGLYFPVSDRYELAALRKLGGRARVQIVGRFSPDELLEGLCLDQLTHLWLAYDLGASMDWLAAFPHLTTLRVNPRLPRVHGVPHGIRILS